VTQFPGKKKTDIKCWHIYLPVSKTARFVESYQIHFEKDLSKWLLIIQTLEQKSFLRLHLNCFSNFRFLLFFNNFFLKTLISLLGHAEVTAIVWQLRCTFFHISASFGKTTMACDCISHLVCHGNKHFYHTLANRPLCWRCKLDSVKLMLNLRPTLLMVSWEIAFKEKRLCRTGSNLV